MSDLAQRLDVELLPEVRRVIDRTLSFGNLPDGSSRTEAITNRVMALDEPQVDTLLADVLTGFAGRHGHFQANLVQAAAAARSCLDGTPLSRNRELLLGAAFTAEYAIEAAALCNPSAMLHPDQSGLTDGQARLAVSVRGVGEGHISSIGFAEAVVGPGPSWRFESRQTPLTQGSQSAGQWRREHLCAVLDQSGLLTPAVQRALSQLPDEGSSDDAEQALEGHDEARRVAASAYRLAFPDSALSQRVLFPTTQDERAGMEDARFVRFTGPDGTVDYRATYTAFDGSAILPRLLTSPDLRTFETHRLAGAASRNKGMALFPRLVGGRHLALCRADGQTTSLTSSRDGFTWDEPHSLLPPLHPWEMLQVGNCGSPIETEHGWLVLTHGVGPMRVYSIGAVLLDLDDPSRVLRRLERPLLRPGPDEQEGYVPHVVYSCGGVVHDGRLWLPYGVGDIRVRVAHVEVDELLAAMTQG